MVVITVPLENPAEKDRRWWWWWWWCSGGAFGLGKACPESHATPRGVRKRRGAGGGRKVGRSGVRRVM